MKKASALVDRLRGDPGFALAALLGLASAAGAQTVATAIEYYHLDAIGNVRVVTNETGQVVRRHDFAPFGEEFEPPTPPYQDRRLFTGKERDPETGRDYFGARYYRADIGRFTTVDPAMTITENLVDPQRWNRYAYARNNPLTYLDPDGRSSVKFDAKEKKIYFYDKDGVLIGSWEAANNTQSSATIGRLVDGTYDFLDKSGPHSHGQQTDAKGVLVDSVDGMFGSSGIFRLKEFTGADDRSHAGAPVRFILSGSNDGVHS